MSPESVSPDGAARQLGKTCRMAVRGGKMMADAARAAGKHPLPISPSREWFALFKLCKALPLPSGEMGLGG